MSRHHRHQPAVTAIALLALLILIVLPLPPSHAADEIGFDEQFVLADDREDALAQLIPGTEDYYYYHALHYQNIGDYKQVDALLTPWIKRYNRTDRVVEIEHRQALLRYSENPKQTLEYLKRHLGLTFPHQRQLLDEKPKFPTALDQSLISRATLLKRAFADSSNLDKLESAALDWLLRDEVALSDTRRRHLLSLLERPDYSNLVALIAADLKTKESRGFGEFKIHRNLVRAQLDELLKLSPELIKDSNYVHTVIQKMRPSADVDWTVDAAVREAYLGEVWSYVSQLAPAFNSLKAHSLHRLLTHYRDVGKYPKALFMEYIKLPRGGGQVNPKYLEDPELRRHVANLGEDFASVTGCPIIGSDDALIREYLEHFFLTEDSYDEYATYLRDTWLKPIFAETKIVNGIGDQEKWYSMLSPAAYQRLKDRVDIEFRHTNPKHFAPGDEVSLEVDVKNVKNLIVKVFEINALNYYKQSGREVNTDLNLDGLVANSEVTHEFDEPALRRVARTFAFPELVGKRGTWIVELIGNGRSSRVVVRKGRLQYLTHRSTAGEIITVLTADNKKAKDPAVWIGGTEYTPNKAGLIVVPFSNRPGRTPVILTDGGFATLEFYQHPAESYALSANFHVDRESLIARNEASVAIRPYLLLNGAPATLSILENVRLHISSTDLDGISSTDQVPEFKLFEDRETTFKFRVPERLRSLGFQLTADVKNLSAASTQQLSAQASFQLNEIDTTEHTAALHLAKFADSFVVELRGKTGEPLAERPVKFAFKHRDFTRAVDVSLKTDESGRITLGALEGIVGVNAAGPDGVARSWVLPEDWHSYPASINAAAGDSIAIPHAGSAAKPQRAEVALFELRAGTFAADRFASISASPGFLSIDDLAPGDYQLHLRDRNHTIAIRITDGEALDDFILSRFRHLQRKNAAPLQITGLEQGDKTLTVKLANADAKFTRVHVIATRYHEDFPLDRELGGFPWSEPFTVTRAQHPSLYLSGRDIGDEFRYILDRRFAKIFPGNMLARPGILLNPWALRDTDTNLNLAQEGQEWERSAPGADSGRGGGGGKQDAARAAGVSSYPNLDFFSHPGVVAYNLIPAKDGTLEIKLEGLGDRQHLHVLAVDPENSAYRQIALAERQPGIRDLRLRNGLDPKSHFTEVKEASGLSKGDKLRVADIGSSQLETYDDLAKVYTLFTTLSGNSTLGDFSFILDWPGMKPEEKRVHYSKFACHELNFFISRRDPEFFAAVVQPYLMNKKDKTFLDNYLIGTDLRQYLEPWEFARLNIVERILLASRIGGAEPSATAKHVADLLELVPKNIELEEQLFATALKGTALGVADKNADGTSFQRAADEKAASKFSALLSRAANEPAAAAAPAPPSTAPEDGAAIVDSLDRFERPGEVAKGKRQLLNEADPGQAPGRGDDATKESHWGYHNADAGVERDLREQVRQLYRKLPKTKEWAENNYYHLPIAQQNASLVTTSKFWRDFAAHVAAPGGKPFLSANFIGAQRNFTEMMFAIAVLDLPFTAAKHDGEVDGDAFEFTAGGPAIVFHKEIKAAPISDDKTPLLISQNHFRHGDRYIETAGEKIDKFVTGEFLAGAVYGCQVVATNPSSGTQKLELLVQIPSGAMPVLGGRRTKSQHLSLAPYHTQTFDYYYYFPLASEEGKPEAEFPAHLARDEKIAAWADGQAFDVVAKLSVTDTASWDYISQHGTPAQVIARLEEGNPNALDLEKIAWRMKDADFFRQILALLHKRHVYNPTLYSYGLYHGDEPIAGQYLLHADSFLGQCGARLVSSLVNIDPVSRHSYQHLEYSPLVNARAHQLGRDRKILNPQFHRQYHELLRVLRYGAKPNAEDRLDLAYYLLLQDRIEDGMAQFARVERNDIPSKLQYDYFACNVAFYNADPAGARQVAVSYREHPVDHWRERFAEVIAEADEIAGVVVKDEKNGAGGDKVAAADAEHPDDGTARDKAHEQLAAGEPSITLKVEGGQVELSYQNVESATINYYEMDLEFLFSTNPFVGSGGADRFSIIVPNKSAQLELDKGGKQVFALPEEFRSTNVLVEVVAAGQRAAQAYYANTMDVRLVENYGRLEVREAKNGQAIPKAYVKVYARLANGESKFYKDGYTDLRGKFDYTSLNTGELDSAQKFAVLVMTEKNGSVVREATPPQQ